MVRLLAIALLSVVVALPVSAARAQSKDTLTVGLVWINDTLDPHMHFQRVGILININMFGSLLHKNTKLEYEPSLATSWKTVNDTTWEFKLRKGVKFHNGDLLTAEDVKYSFERVLEPGKEQKRSPQYGNVRAIKEVRITMLYLLRRGGWRAISRLPRCRQRASAAPRPSDARRASEVGRS